MTEENIEQQGVLLGSEEFYTNFISNSINTLKNAEANGDFLSTVQLFIHEKQISGYRKNEPEKEATYVLISINDELSFYVDIQRFSQILNDGLKDTDYKTLLDGSVNVVDKDKNKLKGMLLVIYNGKTNTEMIKFVEQTKNIQDKKTD
jgi:hypothetical protein